MTRSAEEIRDEAEGDIMTELRAINPQALYEGDTTIETEDVRQMDVSAVMNTYTSNEMTKYVAVRKGMTECMTVNTRDEERTRGKAIMNEAAMGKAITDTNDQRRTHGKEIRMMETVTEDNVMNDEKAAARHAERVGHISVNADDASICIRKMAASGGDDGIEIGIRTDVHRNYTQTWEKGTTTKLGKATWKETEAAKHAYKVNVMTEYRAVNGNAGKGRTVGTKDAKNAMDAAMKQRRRQQNADELLMTMLTMSTGKMIMKGTIIIMKGTIITIERAAVAKAADRIARTDAGT